jgi:GNAT superfamily N-acetyltransferase
VTSDEVIIRRATDDDAEATANMWLRSYTVALPTVRLVHSDEEVRAWFRGVVIPQHDTWIADAAGAIVGVLVLKGQFVEQLYLDPDWRGRGIGDRMVALAKTHRPDGLELWTFQVNGPAQRFYERHGFRAVERTNGADNEEREPDIRYAWSPG